MKIFSHIQIPIKINSLSRAATRTNVEQSANSIKVKRGERTGGRKKMKEKGDERTIHNRKK
jgi:hypothetical protein